MKFMCAVSPEGYMAQGPEDDMVWTPQIDKQIFQIVSALDGGICLVSKQTLSNMPRFLTGRTLIPISSNGLTLEQAYEKFPNALLVSGPTLLKDANRLSDYDTPIIQDLIINQVDIQLLGQDIPEEYRFPFDILTNYHKVIEVQFQDMKTTIYRHSLRSE